MVHTGYVIDRLVNGKIVHKTRTTATWESAHRAAEAAVKRKKLTGDRYKIEIGCGDPK